MALSCSACGLDTGGVIAPWQPRTHVSLLILLMTCKNRGDLAWRIDTESALPGENPLAESAGRFATCFEAGSKPYSQPPDNQPAGFRDVTGLRAFRIHRGWVAALGQPRYAIARADRRMLGAFFLASLPRNLGHDEFRLGDRFVESPYQRFAISNVKARPAKSPSDTGQITLMR